MCIRDRYRAARAGQRSLEGLLGEIDKMMDLAVKAHEQKRQRIAEMMSGPGFPLWQIGKIACDGKPYVELDQATYIIGLIGVNDAIQFLTGEQLHESADALRMAEKIVAHMFLRCKKLSVKHNMKPVSYTHLDVYKRQLFILGYNKRSTNLDFWLTLKLFIDSFS